MVQVFISWSGETTRFIAHALRPWLTTLVQAADVWMSDTAIISGKRWHDEVGKALDASNFGLICLTKENQHRPWLMFESGALAKRLDVAHVVPLYIDLGPSEVTGPLAAWQGEKLDRDGMWRVIAVINSLTDKPVQQGNLQDLFDLTWPRLASAVDLAKTKAPTSDAPKRETGDMLSEIVERVRRIEQGRPSTRGIQLAIGDTVTHQDGSVDFVRSPRDLELQKARIELDMAVANLNRVQASRERDQPLDDDT